MQRAIVDQTGREKGTLAIPDELLSLAAQPDLWWQVSVAEAANRRSGTASTKTRSEVRGGGVKPWRQKGTGRARQGSIRSPQWKGGGVSHGPRPRSYSKEVPRRQRRVAFYSLLTERMLGPGTVVVDRVELSEGKTKEMLRLLEALKGVEKGGYHGVGQPKIVILWDRAEEKVVRAAANLANVRVRVLREAALSDLLWADRLILTAPAAEEALKEAEKWLAKPTAS